MADCVQDRLARLEAALVAAKAGLAAVAHAEQISFQRLLRLERGLVALAEFTHPGAGGPSLHVQQAALALLDEIRHDLADYGQTKGGR